MISCFLKTRPERAGTQLPALVQTQHQQSPSACPAPLVPEHELLQAERPTTHTKMVLPRKVPGGATAGQQAGRAAEGIPGTAPGEMHLQFRINLPWPPFKGQALRDTVLDEAVFVFP